jgi:membrane fusion protein (multidrug efflux system)
MKKKIAFAVLLVLVVIGVLAGVRTLQIRRLIAGAKAFAQPPETVSSTVVRQEKWQGTLTAIGSVVAAQGVTITPDIPGTVRELAFESGALVQKGDLLVRLDTSTEIAQLRAIEAQVDLARITLDRVANLRRQEMIAQSELDAADAALKQAKANADTIRATIDKKTIRAPFAGRLGLRLVNLGQYLDTGKPIVSLQALSPIYIDFSLPQQELAKLKPGLAVRLATDTYPGQAFEGVLSAINPDLDAATRSISLRATFQNAEQLLRPGMFARAEVQLPEEADLLVIPKTSVLSEPYGDSVYLIEPRVGTNGAPAGLAVRQQFIRPGRERGDLVSVQAGLKAGDRIVGAGLFKLRNGMAVVENNELAPKSEGMPHPADN